MTPYYEDELVTLYHGDCLTIDAWLSADVLVTDPPYGTGQAFTVGLGFSDTGPRRVRSRVAGDSDQQARDNALALWGDRPAVVFGGWKQPRPANVRHLLVWDKVHQALPGGDSAWQTSHEEIYILGSGFIPGCRTTVYRVPGLRGADRPAHPTPKPVGLLEQLIEACPPGVVADPFAGSGATLVAARNLGRRAIGVELEERYCEIVANRLAQGVLV